ncbi:hypothetical protein BMW24_023435 [Mycobacterium heckeshornense]|nr:hypothetical protein BMW24_023435 [Mycobacterium heckeshornense]
MLAGMKPSIGTVGDAYDNALAETIIGLYKTEAIRKDSPFRTGPLRSVHDVEHLTADWVHWYRAPRGAVGSNGGENPSSVRCRGSGLKLGAA